jgi:hypothetical protein
MALQKRNKNVVLDLIQSNDINLDLKDSEGSSFLHYCDSFDDNHDINDDDLFFLELLLKNGFI